MSKFITEMLDAINQDPSSIVKYKDSSALKVLFQYAFDPKNKFLLPEGTPPYKEDSAPLGMSPANFIMEMRRLYIFGREDLGKVRRESLFITLLEGLHPTEAKVLIAIKDQDLSRLYSNITAKLVYDNGFIDYVPMETTVPKQEVPPIPVVVQEVVVVQESVVVQETQPQLMEVESEQPSVEQSMPVQEVVAPKLTPVKSGPKSSRKNSK